MLANISGHGKRKSFIGRRWRPSPARHIHSPAQSSLGFHSSSGEEEEEDREEEEEDGEKIRERGRKRRNEEAVLGI